VSHRTLDNQVYCDPARKVARRAQACFTAFLKTVSEHKIKWDVRLQTKG
jgi:hypothetical protein